MKKVFALLTVAGMLTFGTFNSVYAQDAEEVVTEETMEVDSAAEANAAAAEAEAAKALPKVMANSAPETCAISFSVSSRIIWLFIFNVHILIKR